MHIFKNICKLKKKKDYIIIQETVSFSQMNLVYKWGDLVIIN